MHTCGLIRTMACLAAGLVVLAPPAGAQVERAGDWEAGVTLLDLSSMTARGLNGSSIQVDDETGIGFAGAYHFTDQLALGLDFSYSEPGYVATLVPDSAGPVQIVNTKLGVDVIQLKGIFNLLDSDITPYIEIGAGWTYVDSNIYNGHATSTCWWDPWWGYICNTEFDTYTETETVYSYALGVRWDIDSRFVLRGAWGVLNIDTNRTTEDIELDTIQLTFGWKF